MSAPQHGAARDRETSAPQRRARRLVALALVPLALVAAWVLLGTTAPRHVDSCSDPTAFFDPVGIDAVSRPYPGQSWAPAIAAQRRVAGEIPGAGRDRPLLGFELRRYWDLPLRFQNPTYGLRLGIEPEQIESKTLVVDGVRIPVRVATQRLGGYAKVAVYAFFHRDAPVSGAFMTRVRSAPRAFMEGIRPITGVIVGGQTAIYRLEELERLCTDWITNAWKHYQRTCGF